MVRKDFAKILVAFDGSQDSVKAVKRACTMAKQSGASVTIIHVYSIPALAYGGPGPMPLVDLKGLEESAREKAKQTLKRGEAVCKEEGISAEPELVEAPSAVKAIVDCAVEEGFDLVVIGTRGMTGFKKLLLGSVSGGVVTHAPCSVLVVR